MGFTTAGQAGSTNRNGYLVLSAGDVKRELGVVLAPHYPYTLAKDIKTGKILLKFLFFISINSNLAV